MFGCLDEDDPLYAKPHEQQAYGAEPVGKLAQNSFSAGINQAVASNTPDSDYYKPDFAKSLTLAPKQSIEIEIPFETAQNFGLTFMAASDISATLFNDKGIPVGKNLTKTPEASASFGSIYADKNVTGGMWKLKLENTSDRELKMILATWKNAVK